MRIATLQFAPQLGQVQDNIHRANEILNSSRLGRIDLLVLTELAFTGYNFASLEAIEPYLEPSPLPATTIKKTTSNGGESDGVTSVPTLGPSAQWAIETATRLGCHVTVGYPETVKTAEGRAANYNSSVTVDEKGQVVANYRKSFLYYTDETWADEGSGSSEAQKGRFLCTTLPGLGDERVGFGICMDMNPYRFAAPWTEYEFANAMLDGGVRLVVMSMAWLTRLLPSELDVSPLEPDTETLVYWLERFYPMVKAAPAEPVIVVLANRCGTETNAVGDGVELESRDVAVEGSRVCYAGSSCVFRFHQGKIEILDRLGKLEEGLLQIDTAEPAKYLLKHG